MLPWPVWAYLVYCRKTHQGNWCPKSTGLIGAKYHLIIVKRTLKAGIIGYSDRNTRCLCSHAELAAGFCLPNRVALVDICFVGIYHCCHCFIYRKL